MADNGQDPSPEACGSLSVMSLCAVSEREHMDMEHGAQPMQCRVLDVRKSDEEDAILSRAVY